ncbi:MAG: 3-phosphoserine/phosphohydroxythreonine transaminase [Elusimicrobiota bacterium]|nr:3-phosphoserine/phosphohydroxythreonine transaminase [Elusimicrobiota bacterium]
MSKRLFNFNAGPSTLPLKVLKEVKKNVVEYGKKGLSILEMSHRSDAFEAIVNDAKQSVKSLMKVPDNYEILFLQGGASMQFCMVPYNLLKDGETVDFVNTGSWTNKAIKEAKKFGNVNIAASSEDKGFSYIPEVTASQFSDNAEYVHITSNNTIAGTQWADFPETPSPLVADMSSDIMSRNVDVSKFGIIFAGAQKNIGPAGVTLVIIRKDLIGNCPESVPTMLNYETHAKKNSMFNTPPCFPIYVVQLVLKNLLKLGGIDKMEEINNEKAGLIYDAIDAGDYYTGKSERNSRSKMNVTFRLPSEELEAKFIAEGLEKGLHGLKGHRSVGGVRASIYNAMPLEGVEKLVGFMGDFKKNN